MTTSPMYVFEDINSEGIGNVPISGFILIRDNGSGEPLLATKTAQGTYLTIGEFLASSDYQTFEIASELERIANSAGQRAWRLIGRNPDYYIDPGEESVDFSAGITPGGGGAGGFRSFAEGEDVTATGFYSHAEGQGTIASGDWSHAQGNDAVASADYGYASGRGTLTNGNVDAASVFGRYNGSITATSQNIFEVGMGTSELNRANAFEVDTCSDGIAGPGPVLRAPMTEIDNIIRPRDLITKEYLDQAIDEMWLGDLVDVTAIPEDADVSNIYTGATKYKLGDVIRDPGGVIYRCKADPNYISAGDLDAIIIIPGGTQADFDLELGLGYWILNTNTPVVNSLLAYNPYYTSPDTNMGTGRWENVKDLDFGYYP